MDIGLTTLQESDIAKHVPTAQSFIERTSVLVPDGDGKSKVELAGTRRRFVSTVSSAGTRKAEDVRFVDTLSSITPDDPMLSPVQHTIAVKTRRALAVGLAVRDVFARQTELESLSVRNREATLAGDAATHYHRLLAASAFVTVFAAASYLAQTIEAEAEPSEDLPDPLFMLETPHDACKAFVYALERGVAGAPDDAQLAARLRAVVRETLEGLIARRQRFDELASFEATHIRLDGDDFTLNGFDIEDRARRKPLVMTFKKPDEVVGNHIAKFQSMKLAKMLMAYDFNRQLNPFVELGGFLFSFIGDGYPGTGKTTLIQMIAGILSGYCEVAGFPFHYENFGVDQISSYQGKSGQNCKQFVRNVMDPRVIGFGTVDDIDQVAAKRSDDRASAGQQEVTAVLMESLSGASTVVRGNCSFGMFSNYPENVDDALRQRAGARWLVDGPQTQADYIDIFALLIGRNHKLELGDHTLFKAQEIVEAVTTAYGEHDRPHQPRLAAIHDRFVKEHGKPDTLEEIGRYLHAIKEDMPSFTGRSIKNITDAAKMRAMDIDLPDEWFETPEPFLHQDYDRKRNMIAELRGPITLDMMLQEVHRYADSEYRYADKSDEAAVAGIVREQKLRERAAGEIVARKENGTWNA
jgi:hypothetical protein